MVEGEYGSNLIGPARVDIMRDSKEIEEDVRELVSLNDAIHSEGIDVSVDTGIVTLRGKVRDQVSSDEAVQAARDVAGVLDVRNELEVG